MLFVSDLDKVKTKKKKPDDRILNFNFRTRLVVNEKLMKS